LKSSYVQALQARNIAPSTSSAKGGVRTPLTLQAMLTRAHPNVVVVALAAKLARIAWAVLHTQKDFDRHALAAA